MNKIWNIARRTWAIIMDPSQNPLMALPKIVRFQLMAIISLLWSMIFCVMAGIMVWLPGYVFIHIILVSLGIFGTGWIFSSAQKFKR